ncbi:MAG: type II restriction endonuclease [Planctomycetes bacterium]|nr:type II restriction endonuclease [Planctomycetota bacterium]
MSNSDILDWIKSVSRPGTRWVLKRLSGNDTGRTGSHGAGPYLPKHLLFELFPEIADRTVENPDVYVSAAIDSHAAATREVRVIWYNNAVRGGTRNEARVTGWGGAASPLLDTENTGALVCIAVQKEGDRRALRIWVCRNEYEEDRLEDLVGAIEPSQIVQFEPQDPESLLDSGKDRPSRRTGTWLAEIPDNWRIEFPRPAELSEIAVRLEPGEGLDVDHRLLRRRACEEAIYNEVRDAHLRIALDAAGDDLAAIRRALMSEAQRSRARSGISLERHLEVVFREEGLAEHPGFETQAETERGNLPDFLFPSASAYRNVDYPSGRLRMLAAKSTIKDRWRQVLREADRIWPKHLMTLQQGVSAQQFAQITDARVKLVVPAPTHKSYSDDVRERLLSLSDFVLELRDLV